MGLFECREPTNNLVLEYLNLTSPVSRVTINMLYLLLLVLHSCGIGLDEVGAQIVPPPFGAVVSPRV